VPALPGAAGDADCTNDKIQTDSVLASGAVPLFVELLQHPKMNIVKLIC
jgi:hypothetical protein